MVEAVELGRHILWLLTYGAAGTHPQGYTDIRDANINVVHPVYAKPVGQSMPSRYAYDADSQTLTVGAGEWTQVTPEAAAYEVGGTNVINSWLDYRLAVPRKRRSSPLDDINSNHWDPDWSAELTNLLSVVT